MKQTKKQQNVTVTPDTLTLTTGIKPVCVRTPTDFTEKPQQIQLFSNEIGQRDVFGISRRFTDNLTKITDKMTPEAVKESYKYHGKTFKVNDKLGLRIIDTGNKITNVDDFYNALLKIKSGKALQTLLALWYYSNKQGSFSFNGTRLSEVMETVLKLPTTGYYTQDQKREFTNAVHILRDFEIYLDEEVKERDDKGRKKNMVRRDYYKLINLIGAVYAKKRDGIVDESVIVKLYGELLPSFNKGIMRGRLYNRGLLELDANKDERAILLGFKLLTRFDQLRQGRNGRTNAIVDDQLYIDTTRKQLIEWGDYEKTELTNPREASKQLQRTLEKLVNIKCLHKYTPAKITTDNALRIRLYPRPLTAKQEDIKKLEEGDTKN